LEQARQERYSNWLVYALGRLLLALLAAGVPSGGATAGTRCSFGHGPWWGKDANGRRPAQWL
jgi:hypothetical protein